MTDHGGVVHVRRRERARARARRTGTDAGPRHGTPHGHGAHGGDRPSCPDRRAGPARGLHGLRGGVGHLLQLPGPAGRRRPHADRRRGHRRLAGGLAPGGPPRDRVAHLRPQAGGDPGGDVQRDLARRGGRARDVRGHRPPPQPFARRRRRPDRRRLGRGGGQPAGHDRHVAGQPRVVERGGRLPAHPHRPLRLHRHGHRRHRHRDQRIRAGRRHRLACSSSS